MAESLVSRDPFSAIGLLQSIVMKQALLTAPIWSGLGPNQFEWSINPNGDDLYPKAAVGLFKEAGWPVEWSDSSGVKHVEAALAYVKILSPDEDIETRGYYLTTTDTVLKKFP